MKIIFDISLIFPTSQQQNLEPRLPEEWEVVSEGKIFNFGSKKYWR
jgi:hypothetical protein